MENTIFEEKPKLLFAEHNYKFMYSALIEAEKAYEAGEVPIGAVVVFENKIIGKGFNQSEMLHDATAHAEMIALTSAGNQLRAKYLDKCEIYVTVEPCLMCAGAILLNRIKKLYFGTFEPRFGACGSLYNIVQENKYNHKIEVYSGIYSDESRELMTRFFEDQRNKKQHI